jgi:putative ABC transport system permease protein
MTLVVRAYANPANSVTAIRDQVWEVDKDQPVANIRTMDQVVSTSIEQRRFNMLVLNAFAAFALILAAMGIYGVISYSVAQRTHEIGIRMSLGAQQYDILKLVVGEGIGLTVIGVAIGLAGAFAVTRAISSFLFGVSATDPVTFAVIALLLSGTGALASYIPARRATKVDPIVALRYE